MFLENEVFEYRKYHGMSVGIFCIILQKFSSKKFFFKNPTKIESGLSFYCRDKVTYKKDGLKWIT